MKSLVKHFMSIALIVLGAMGAWAQTPTTRILDNIPVGWIVTVTVNNEEVVVPVTPYYTDSPLGSAIIPEDAEVVLTPPDSVKPRVKRVSLLAPEEIPLTFEAKAAGATVAFHLYTDDNVVTNPVEYSTDGSTWKTYKSDSAIVLTNIGDKVSFRGNNTKYAVSPEGDASYFSCSADCYVYGNVMSLINKDNFATTTALTSDHTFCSLFSDYENNSNSSHIYNHPTKALVLPATTLSSWCYADMFKGCTNLTSAPVLPAMSMAEKCYYHMFVGCTSLTAAPALPATSLAEECYSGMFGGCTSLETAPTLPATTLALWCYYGMFEGCTSLETAPALPATTLASCCYRYMFYGCTNLTTAPALPVTTLVDGCYEGMFIDCTSLATAPALPATTLDDQCYYEMFSGCTSLTTAPALPAETLADECYYSMFSGCKSLTTAPLLPAQTLTYACYSHMFDSCSLLNSVTCLATDISAQLCTTNWLNKVAETGTFIKPASMTSWLIDNPSGIPEGWTPTIYELQPLTFEAMTAGATVTFTKATTLPSLTVEYSTDGTTWHTYTEPITLADSADKVMFRGNNATYATEINIMYNDRYSHFSCNNCCVYGNIMSLIDASNYPTATELTQNYTFSELFKDNSNICNHPTKALVLPATTLSDYCYSCMFWGCTGLTKAPALLPATTLANGCYSSMFVGCTSLTTAPALPATTLTERCYSVMFQNCSSLSTVPELPATALAENCYASMFEGCTNLTTVPATLLPATTMKSDCYHSMFNGCTNLETAPELPATTLESSCYLFMFQGCESLTTAPELPATTLKPSCYYYMFSGCTSLTTAPVLPATTLAKNCYYRMFKDCTNLNSVTCLATDISASYCTSDWLNGVAATGTFTKAASMNDWTTGASGIPSGWTVVSILDLSTVTANTTVPNGCVVTGTLNGNYKISIAAGATVTLDNVKINEYGTLDLADYAGLNCLGNATIILKNGTTNTVKGFGVDYPGIHIPSGYTLTIQGTGTLNASSIDYSYSAGIGGGNMINCGNITINSGTIIATCGRYESAGIGSGKLSSCGDITINGGTITATGGNGYSGRGGAGIGSGYASSCGNITINGGIVMATGGDHATGIGSGAHSSCGNITIKNTVTSVTATKGSDAPNSIGSGYSCTSCGTVKFGDATVYNGSAWSPNPMVAGNYGGLTLAISTTTNTNDTWTLTPIQIPEGAFTINGSGDQVFFAPGNLQYQASTSTWRFAEHQWDYVGSANASISSSYTGWIDLFGWGTSGIDGYNPIATCYQPYSTSQNNGEYNPYGSKSTNLYDGGDNAGKADWGYAASAANLGGYSTWRTLTKDEWTYLCDTRTKGGTVFGTSQARYTEATINTDGTGVNGIILFPDGVDIASSEVTTAGTVNGASNWTTKCTTDQWTALEAKGCVFLPAAGYRNGTSVSGVSSYVCYWSSSYSGDYNAYYVRILSNTVYPQYSGERFKGSSVRLVRDAN